MDAGTAALTILGAIGAIGVLCLLLAFAASIPFDHN